MYLRIFNKDGFCRYSLDEDNSSFVIFDNGGERITLRQEYVRFSSGFIYGIFFVRFLSALRQMMIAVPPLLSPNAAYTGHSVGPNCLRQLLLYWGR